MGSVGFYKWLCPGLYTRTAMMGIIREMVHCTFKECCGISHSVCFLGRGLLVEFFDGGPDN